MSRTTIRLLFGMILALPGSVSAELAPTSLDDLIDSSDLIVMATVGDIHDEANGSGYSVLRVDKVLKGEHVQPSVRVTWSSEEHDQRIDRLGQRLLFLKDRDGKLSGTHYGRSYWPLEPASRGCTASTPYVYPVNTVEITVDGLVREADIYVPWIPMSDNPVRMKAICVDDVERLIKKVGEHAG